jgi:hypothetical protein
VGELACGNVRDRSRVLSDLEKLPAATVATHHEVMGLIERSKLWGLGIGWIDAHLLASALLSKSELWTMDLPMLRAAAPSGVKLYKTA